MKFLENPNLETLGEILSSPEDNLDGRLEARIESYSCKLTSEDKKMFGRTTIKRGVSPHDLAALSPPSTTNVPPPHRTRTWSTSSNEGGLVGACSRKTLFYLISTLNHSYGADYDFTASQSDEFSHEPSVAWVKNFIDSTLTACISSKFTPQLKNQLWGALENEISPSECEIYSYNPDKDPNDDEPSIWSFSFFFFNKRLKRIVYFSVRSVSSCSFNEFNEEESIEFDHASVEVY